jgi:threonine synthase
MDILVSSNLERLLFMAAGSDPLRTTAMMRELTTQGWFEIEPSEKSYLSDFRAGWCGDGTARSMIAEVWNNTGLLVDPHTAVALAVGARVARDLDPATPIVVASTASPFKFPRACAESLVDSGTWIETEDLGDLDIAAELSRVTGTKFPSAIAGLNGKKIVHGKTLDVGEVELALASFASKASPAC